MYCFLYPLNLRLCDCVCESMGVCVYVGEALSPSPLSQHSSFEEAKLHDSTLMALLSPSSQTLPSSLRLPLPLFALPPFSRSGINTASSIPLYASCTFFPISFIHSLNFFPSVTEIVWQSVCVCVFLNCLLFSSKSSGVDF